MFYRDGKCSIQFFKIKLMYSTLIQRVFVNGEEL